MPTDDDTSHATLPIVWRPRLCEQQPMVCSERIGPHEPTQYFRHAKSPLPRREAAGQAREDPARVRAPATPASTTSSDSCSIVGELACLEPEASQGGKLAICDLVAEQYPLVIFHGDVGTGKTAMAECIANQTGRRGEE